MAGPKYKVKIIIVGVGDPFLLFRMEFVSGSGFVTPPENHIHNFEVGVSFCNSSDNACGDGDTTNFSQMGIIRTDLISTNGPYYFGLPFDNLGFTVGDALTLRLAFSGNNDEEFVITGDNQSDQSNRYIKSLNYSDSNTVFPPIWVAYEYQNDN